MLRLIGVLLLIPLLDIMLLLVVGDWIGFVPTVAIVVLTGLVGMLLVRAEGRHTVRKIQRKLGQGEAPTDELIDGGLLIAAGAFLLTPGLVTDIVGFLLVIPITRYPIRLAVKKWVVVPYADAKTRGFVTGEVYTGGFPGNVDISMGDRSGGTGGETVGTGERSPGDDTYDVDDDSYDIDDGDRSR